MGFSLGTGFLYNWGNGISGEQFIPENITGVLFSGIAIGENFNASAAVVIPTSGIIVTPGEKIKNFGRFKFELFTPYASISPINTFQKISTIFRTGGIQNTGISKENFLEILTTKKEENIVLNRGLIVSGVSGNTSISTFISSKRNDRNYLSGDSWLQYSGEFSYNDFTGFQNDDAGIILRDVGLRSTEITKYRIDYGVDPNFTSGSGKNTILFKNLKIDYPTGTFFDASNEKIWASYQLDFEPKLSGYQNFNNLNFNVFVPGTVNNSRNVFAYAFEFIDIVTLRDSGTLVVSEGPTEDPFANLRQLEEPRITSGFDTSFSNYIGYCFTRKTCPDAVKDENEDVFLCWTGSGSEPAPTSRQTATGRAYVKFLSEIRETYKNQSAQKNTFDGLSDLTLSSGVLVSGLFRQQTGQLIYNSFFSGDTISFKLYPFNYDSFYRSYHLGNTPLFPETGFTIRYPQDFTGIDNLVTVLNNRLSGISYPVWYPYDCLSGESTGIYMYGGLMAFEKDVIITTGNKNYNNLIKFRSLRNYASGFQLSLNLVDREEFIQDLELQYFRKGFSYLIPDVIELQARTGDQWLILDRRQDLYNKFTGLERTLVPLDAKPELFLDNSNQDWLSSLEVTGTGTSLLFDFEEILLEGGFLELNRFEQKGFNPGNVPPYCPGAGGKSFQRSISVVTPTGWPTGVDGCNPKLLEEGTPCPETVIPFCDESLGCQLVSGSSEGCPSVTCECPEKPKENLELFLSVLRTGWTLELTGVYLNCLTGPDFDPNKISFPEYRFVAKNFSGLKADIKNQYLIPKRETYFTNVNLFSVKPSGIGIHEGEAKCLIGSNYELQIQDIVALPFNTVFDYSISGEDFSGIYKALDQIVTYVPTEEERNVKFVRRPGKIVGNATGLVNGEFTGRNFIEHSFVGSSPSGYFYNPELREVYFTQKVSGFFERSGILNTGIFVLKEEVINFELLAGGRLNTAPEYIEASGSGFYTGILRNERYFQTGARGIYNLTGKFSGFSTSGFFDILIPTGTRYTGDGFIEPFVSGRIFSGSPILLQSGFQLIVKPFPSENFISGNFSTLNSLISGDFITSNNYIFRSPDNCSVFIINTGVITGVSLNPVFPFPTENSVTGFGEYRDPNGFVFRNRVRTLMTGNFFVRRSDKSCFDFWPETLYPLNTIATITGFTSNSFVSGRTGIISGYSGNLLIDKGSFALLTGFTSTGFITGSSINFTKTNYGNEVDIINNNISLTRDNQYPIYNPLYQTDASDNNWSNNSGVFSLNPAYTLWNRDGWTNLNNLKNRQYTGLNSLWGGGQIGSFIVGTELIMWDFLGNQYYLIKFNQWTQAAGGGGFSYIRSQISTAPSKEMYSPLSFTQNETILIENKNPFLTGENRIKGLYRIKNILTGDQNTNFSGLKYVFSCLNDNDIVFNSPANKNVYITSTGNLIGRPVFATQQQMSGTSNKPFFPIPTGFIQASTNISFNFNTLRTFDRLSINNTTISYHPDASLYPAPDYFSNLDSLLSIINSNPAIFNVIGDKLNDSGISLNALNDFQPGSSGNNLQISEISSGIFIPTDFLTGGQTFYPIMAPTSLFSGFATGKVGVTGIFSETGSGIISGFVPSFTGIRTFTGIWNIKSGFNNNFRSYFANNLISGNNYFSSQLFENEYNIVQLLISYNNQLNTTENILDVAALKVKDLNYNKIFPTGSLDVTGEIIFRITGSKTL